MSFDALHKATFALLWILRYKVCWLQLVWVLFVISFPYAPSLMN